MSAACVSCLTSACVPNPSRCRSTSARASLMELAISRTVREPRAARDASSPTPSSAWPLEAGPSAKARWGILPSEAILIGLLPAAPRTVSPPIFSFGLLPLRFHSPSVLTVMLSR